MLFIYLKPNFLPTFSNIFHKKSIFLIFSATYLIGNSCDYDQNLQLSCPTGEDKTAYRVTYNPYEDVVWGKWSMVLSQHHDHLDTIANRYHSYDKAGYEAVVTMDYSGVASLAYTWEQRITFPSKANKNPSLTNAPEANNYVNLKLFIPGMEEVGYEPLTSPFLKTYISKKERKFPSDIGPLKRQLN